jgi:predicted permease
MRRLFRLWDERRDAGRDVRAEIAFHLEMRAQELVAEGMSPEEARRAAAAAFGDVAAVEAEVSSLATGTARRRRLRDALRAAVSDAAFALRVLRKNRGFAAAAVATLAVGLGATTAVFTVVDGVLLRPLPYADPRRLAMVWLTGSAADGLAGDLPLSSGVYLDARRETRTLGSFAAFRSWTYTVAGDGPAERVAGARVTPSLFATLGVRPILGRTFTDAEALPGSPHVALVGFAYWKTRFGGSPDVVGKRVALSGDTFTIVGVLPEGFSFPRGAELPGGLQFAPRTDVWTPLAFTPADERGFGTLDLAGVARLAPGVAPAVAQSELTALLHRLLEIRGSKTRLDFHVVSLEEQAGGPVRRNLLMLMGAVGFVLLIACANVANLLLARTAARERELAVRAALGAGRSRIARQLASENVLLALLGAAAGFVLALWGVRAMLALVPGAMPRVDDVALDARVIGAALGAAVALGAAFGVGTALRVRWDDLAAALRASGRAATAGPRGRLGRRLLVVLEIALSLVLLVGALELTSTFVRLSRVTPGFVPEHALVADVQLPLVDGFFPARDGPRWRSFFAQLLSRVSAAPGVVAVGAVSSLPLTGAFESSGIAIVGRPRPAQSGGLPTEYLVTGGRYFDAMGIRLLEGRVFDSRDGSDGAQVAVVNRELARRYFGGASPLGAQLLGFFEYTAPAPRTIVGVVDDVLQASLDGRPEPQVYVPEAQMPYPGLTVVARTTGRASLAAAPLRAAVRALDATASVAEVRPLQEVTAASLARQRFTATLVGIFAAAALVLSMVGLYGVLALQVGQRRREIGVRMALGARASDVLRLLLGEGMRLTAAGVALGVLGAIALSRLLRALLYGPAGGPPLYAGAALGVALVSLAATWIPARRAARVDPTVSLRAD